MRIVIRLNYCPLRDKALPTGRVPPSRRREPLMRRHYHYGANDAMSYLGCCITDGDNHYQVDDEAQHFNAKR